MDIKVTNCNDCPFGQTEWDLDYDYFWLRCSLEDGALTQTKHHGSLKNINKHKFKTPKHCKLKQEKEIIVNFGV